MKKIKRWLYNKFLPAWCRDDLLEENTRLRNRVSELKQENARLNSYIDGVHDALHLSRKITIKNGGGAGERVLSSDK